MTIQKTDAFEYHRVLERLAQAEADRDGARKELRDMTTERDALVSVKIALVDKVEVLENLIASMVIECDSNMPAKAAWLARRNGLAGDGEVKS